jgi:hypothetical protein
MKKHDEVLTWSGLHGTNNAIVRVRVYDDMIFPGRFLVFMTEPNDNPGTSVTNGVETVAAVACETFELNPANCTFIEHYPAQPGRHGRRHSFDVVTFETGIVQRHGRRGEILKKFETPTWRPIAWTYIRNSIVDKDDPAGLDF